MTVVAGAKLNIYGLFLKKGERLSRPGSVTLAELNLQEIPLPMAMNMWRNYNNLIQVLAWF